MTLFRLLACTALTATVLTAPAGAETLRGTVTYRERMALPQGAEIEVKLVDISRADAPAAVLAETTLRPDHAAPFPFALDYDASDITQGHRYALEVRITAEERLLFITRSYHPAFDRAPGEVEIVVERVTSASPAGRWRLNTIAGQPAAEGVDTVIEIAGDGTLSGSGGCNLLTGKATIEGETIGFGHVANTMMACPSQAMAQERALLDVLTVARRWQVDQGGQGLVLMDETRGRDLRPFGASPTDVAHRAGNAAWHSPGRRRISKRARGWRAPCKVRPGRPDQSST